MIRAILILLVLTTSAYAQTPFDKFLPEGERIPMLELKEKPVYILENRIDEKIAYLKFDKESLKLKAFNIDDKLLYEVQLRPTDKKWLSRDPKPNISISPYASMEGNPILYNDPGGDTINVTNRSGTSLFQLDNGSDEMTSMTAKQVYDQGTQWFAPNADNYMAIMNVNENITKENGIKHFSWGDIQSFSEVDRWMLSYGQGGSGDWKASEDGANGFFLVTVDGQPYWADAIGQIPFAVDAFTDYFAESGSAEKAIKQTLSLGMTHGDGDVLNPVGDFSNSYDNHFILSASIWASQRYQIHQYNGGGEFFSPSIKLMKAPTALYSPLNNNILRKYGIK